MFTVAALREMWANAWPVMSLLLLSSIFSFAIMLERWAALSRFDFDRETLLEKLRQLIGERKLPQAAAYCDALKRPIGKILHVLLDPPALDKAAGRDHLDRLAGRLVRSEASKMLHYVTALGTIGSIAPFVGLFGTVLGIIHAFKAIAENAGGGPSVVAHGIAEALVTTALGLFVAIPAVIAYNTFTRKIDRITEDMELCAQEVIDLTVKP
jgi:biopolymer transport protein ExbB/biopolymer transport protein TolQ